MPEYDEKFLLDCSNFEKQRWRSYNFKFKFKPLDTNSNYLLSPVIKYSPFKGGGSAINNSEVNGIGNGGSSVGEYRHSFYGFPTDGESRSK